MSDRDRFRERANHVIQEAWEVNGAPGISDPIETQLRILNGLLAMALTEVCAPPRDDGSFGGSPIRLYQIFTEAGVSS